jgi:sulfite oxidase
MPVQSLVCNPSQNSIVGARGATDITVTGVAWSGGGRKIERVDVSIDGGKVRALCRTFVFFLLAVSSDFL